MVLCLCFKATRKCFITRVGLRQCILLFCSDSAASSYGLTLCTKLYSNNKSRLLAELVLCFHRIGIAGSCMNLLEIMTSKSNIQLSTMIRLYQIYIVPVVLHGCETCATLCSYRPPNSIHSTHNKYGTERNVRVSFSPT